MNDVSHRIHAIPVCFSGNVTPWQPAGNAPSDPPSSATLLRPEQTVELAPEVADYAYVPQTGRTALERQSSELADNSLPRPGDRGRLIAPVSACPPPVARSVRPRPTSATVCKSVQSCTSLAVRAKHPSRKYRARSSAGEHYLDTVGVTGSIPVAPTISRRAEAQRLFESRATACKGPADAQQGAGPATDARVLHAKPV